MNGIACPNCDGDTEILSTDNEWDLYCRSCDIRFKEVVANKEGILSFNAADGGLDVIFVAGSPASPRDKAYVAYNKEWPEVEMA
jgi:hypothetical protein